MPKPERPDLTCRECGKQLIYDAEFDRYACPATRPYEGMGLPTGNHVWFVSGESANVYKNGAPWS